MKGKLLPVMWGVMFILCAGCGFIPEPEGAGTVLLFLLALGFFLPPALLVYEGVQEKKREKLILVRNVSALSLGLTLVLLIANFLSVFASEALGSVLYYVLVVVSAPMVCSGNWAFSLFLWACLLMVSLKYLRKK